MNKLKTRRQRAIIIWQRLDQRLWRTVRRNYWRVVLSLLCMAIPLAGWAFWWEPDSLAVHSVTLEIPAWPANLNGFKILVLSDLHIGAPHITLDKVRRIVTLSNEQQPDLTVLLGDYVIQGVVGGHPIEPEVFAPILQDLRARYGVYAVLGNHDWNFDGARITDAFTRVNLSVLTNDAVRIQTQQNDFWVVGIGDLFTHHQDFEKAFAKINTPAPIIAITHTPDVFLKLPPAVILTLAGHTHGGQVNLPLLGRRVVPSDFGDKYARGYVEEKGKRIFVTSGIGTSILPTRFRVPPEIVVLTLKHKS